MSRTTRTPFGRSKPRTKRIRWTKKERLEMLRLRDKCYPPYKRMRGLAALRRVTTMREVGTD